MLRSISHKFQEELHVLNKKILYVEQLLRYGIEHGMIAELDVDVTRNALWKRLDIECDLDQVDASNIQVNDIYLLLDLLTEAAKADGEPLEYQYQVEMFQAEIMALLMPRNSEINAVFWALHRAAPKFATEYFYNLSNASTYIRMDRVSKNISWKSPSKFGDLDITINLSKPEKDPKEIELQKHAKPSVYPKCLLCVENAGYSGNISHPARHNHRIVEMTLGNEPWYLQYSPYVYYNEHAIVLCREHRNMKIDRNTFIRLCDFVDFVPHYFIGSNADLHTVGGSILSHDHYQAGNYEMPMMRAKTVYSHTPKTAPDVRIDVIEWPLSVLKLVSTNRQSIIDLSARILNQWIDFSDEAVDLVAHTFERHNTITPILRKNGANYEMYLALRNNRKTEAHPDGLFHPHAEHHHIKRENIGLIEVMGLAVLPSRLVEEVDAITNALLVTGVNEKALRAIPSVVKHVEWVMSLEKPLVAILNDTEHCEEKLHQFFEDQIGAKFECVLEDAGVYKTNYEAIRKFLEVVDTEVAYAR